jgi:hypothetical protein
MAVAEIWQRFQGRVEEQVRILEQAIATLIEPHTTLVVA